MRAYIFEDNPPAAQKVARRIIDKVNLSRDHPLLGMAGRIHKTRELVVSNTPYTIVYYVSVDLVKILRIFHQSKKWPKNL